MNIYYYSSLDPTSPTGFHYDGSLYQRGPGLCAANALVPSTPIAATPYGPPAGSRALDLVVGPSAVVSLLAPRVQATNFGANATYRLKTPYMIWPKLFRSRDRVDKTVRCELCDMVLNSEQQAKQHFNGKHHLRRLRKQKLNSSASEEKFASDMKQSFSKTDLRRKNTQTKKSHDSRNDESRADVSNNGDPAPDERPEADAEDTAKSRRPKYRREGLNLARLTSDGTTTVEEDRRLEYADSADGRTNPAELGKLDNADLEEELELASDEFLHLSHQSNNQSFLSDSCSSSSHSNCSLIQSSCQELACSSSYSIHAPNRCSLHQNSGLSKPSASCYSSPLLHDVLSQSSLQPSCLTSSVSSSFKMASPYSMNQLRDSGIPSVSPTSFAPGSMLPRP